MVVAAYHLIKYQLNFISYLAFPLFHLHNSLNVLFRDDGPHFILFFLFNIDLILFFWPFFYLFFLYLFLLNLTTGFEV